MAVLSVVQSAAVSTAQATGGELLEPAPADAVGETASIHVSHIEAFTVDGGEAIFEPGTEYEEAFAYDSVDTDDGLLVGLTRAAPIDHPEGAFVQAVVPAEPSASPKPSTEPTATAEPNASEPPSAIDGGSSTGQTSAVIDPCGMVFNNTCDGEIRETLAENVDCTGTAEDPVGCEVTAIPSCDGEAKAVDTRCVDEVEATLCSTVSLFCNWPPEPSTIQIDELAGPEVEYGLRVPDFSYQIPDVALPGDLNAFSVSPGVPFDPDYPTEGLGGTRSTAAEGSRSCTYTTTSYREGYVGEGDDGFSGADDELGAHTATRASSGPFGINASYREANAWTRAGAAVGFRFRGTNSMGVTVTFPWNTLGEMDIQEGGGRQATGSAWFRLKIMDYTNCPDNATTLNGCASTIASQEVKSYSKANSGITPYHDTGKNGLHVTLYDRHRYVFYIEVETMSTAQGAFTSPSMGYSIVDFFGGSNRGWLDRITIRLDQGRWSKC
jgi:hypothetical protein